MRYILYISIILLTEAAIYFGMIAGLRVSLEKEGVIFSFAIGFIPALITILIVAPFFLQRSYKRPIMGALLLLALTTIWAGAAYGFGVICAIT
jgi:hypothetical protein